MRLGAALAIAAGLLVAPASSRAQTTPRQEEPVPQRATLPAASAWETRGLLGVEAQIRGAMMFPSSASPVQAPGLYSGLNVAGDPTGDILRGRESPYGIEPFGFGATAGYRFLPWLSAGVFFSYATFQANDGTDSGDYRDGTSQLNRVMWTLGAYGRYYVTFWTSRLHPWVELGVGYAGDSASYARGVLQGSSANPPLNIYTLTAKGLVLPLSVGLDWRLAPVFSMGPTVGYERVIPISDCVQVDADSTSPAPSVDTCDSSVVEAHGYGVFSAGIYAKLTLGPQAR
jgi:hypothetical protein